MISNIFISLKKLQWSLMAIYFGFLPLNLESKDIQKSLDTFKLGCELGDFIACNLYKSNKIQLNKEPIDVILMKSVNSIQAVAGATVIYKIKYLNLTQNKIAKATVIKDFFDNTNLEESSFKFNTPRGVSCVITQDFEPSVAKIQGKFLKCEIGDLVYIDGEKNITYSVKIKSTAIVGEKINNTAIIKAENEHYTKLGNNTSSAEIMIIKR